MKRDKIVLGHGSGGRLSSELIREVFLPEFDNPFLSPLSDSAVFSHNDARLAFTTDSYVVDPIFFPGGDIGRLAVYGTVNDLAMSGASPLYLSAGFILEEGLALSELRKVVHSMAEAARECNIFLIAGDTKVVPKGKGDKLFINTSGIGVVPQGVDISPEKATPGDVILINGGIGEHGMAVMAAREGLSLANPIKSDLAPLDRLVARMLSVTKNLNVLRDPTRGGLGTALAEIARQGKVGIVLEEDKIPIKDEVRGACELLGFDPLYVANEGKLIGFCPAEKAERVLSAMKNDEKGRESAIIGKVVSEHPQRVILKTKVGGERLVDLLPGEQLPRIC
jgi:hydrogenase expression/formation protein HypE